ncbi:MULTISPECIES: protein TolR [Shewanella]|jgi:biopolymer transport protein TolR|uniref:Tol-Pal system protein TolR n=2 Tax=Shewanella frigidimarina TaxID=56812 RepID=Q084K3_SHEFN|nr:MULTISPECIES: protein TolR [Shewanella]ABI71312.1 Biopolymer transport protein ExbD/TolR [Shewanella frigidimarina NCIMB 400]KVX02300.1 protein TolR [Shewanella frigidimarina]MBB1428062.1 protein TolR [Shewanella sp. SG44-2]PKI11187.1 protein TolR [Shewanella sp. 11B5]RPA27446.1 protein TolR [Shewanella frigidimarina]|tara:strand:- start:2682 stop:3110 length:429 start_codon:yes stop_codon:yes gene_type:complete
MYQRKRRRPVAEINVVPYIDVMLVLLIIFMVTAPIVSQGVKVELPQGNAESLPPDSKPPIVASIDAAGQYFLNIGSSSNSEVMDLEQVSTEVGALIQLEPLRPVVVKADRTIPYESVIQLMISLQGAGVPAVGLMTDSPKEK